MKLENFEDFLNGYLDAAAFADTPEEWAGRKFRDDFTKMSVIRATAECEKFLTREVVALIEDDEHVPGSWDDTPWNHAGRDFWYTRQGHGCGYWDGDWPKHGDELAELVKPFHEVYIWVGPGGRLYMEESY